MEVPAQIREAAGKTIIQAEQGLSALIAAANNSVSIMPNPTTDLPLKALSLTELSMKAAFTMRKGFFRPETYKPNRDGR